MPILVLSDAIKAAVGTSGTARAQQVISMRGALGARQTSGDGEASAASAVTLRAAAHEPQRQVAARIHE